MKKEYAIYPFEYMGISQRHDTGNHKPHWYNSKNYSDKPIDEACKDTGRSYFVPQNDFIVEEVIGRDDSNTKKITNSVRLKSKNKLVSPIAPNKEEYLYITLTHMNEENLRQIRVGQELRKNSRYLLEGSDGIGTGNHFHITMNHGKYYGIHTNSNDVVCFVYEKSLLPDEAFYIDKSFTTIKNSAGYNFKEVPIEKVGTPVLRNTKENQIEVLADNLRARNKPNGAILGYINKGIYNILERVINGEYEWFRVDNDVWIAYSESWSKLYEKEIETTPPTEPPTEIPTETPTQPIEEQPVEESPITKIIKKIIGLLKKIYR